MKIIPKIVFHKNRLLDEEIMALQRLIKMWDNMLNLMVGRFIKALLYWKTVMYSEINFGVLMYESQYTLLNYSDTSRFWLMYRERNSWYLGSNMKGRLIIL